MEQTLESWWEEKHWDYPNLVQKSVDPLGLLRFLHQILPTVSFADLAVFADSALFKSQ